MSSRPEDAAPPQDAPIESEAPIEDAEHAVPAPTDAPIVLPEIPTADLSLSMDFTTFIDPDSVEGQKIHKRASNVMKLAQENEKLKAELKEMTDRLEAVERAAARRREQLHKEQHIMEEPSS